MNETIPPYEVTAICESPTERQMSLNDYQQAALSTAIYPHDYEIPYLALALGEECGEVSGKVKKVIRDKGGKFYHDDIQAMALELGDVLWYAANLAHVLGYTLSEIAQMNIDKINSRVERGTLHGEGDER